MKASVAECSNINPSDYLIILDNLNKSGGMAQETRKCLDHGTDSLQMGLQRAMCMYGREYCVVLVY
jgi:hypothetical protein